VNASAAERYLTLGLQVGRHVDGIVDSYYGPPELKEAVDAEPPVEPSALASAADALLGELEDGWLRDQVAGLHTYLRVLAGDTMSYADEVEGCYGVRPPRTDEAVFAEAHERLDEVLPGAGSPGERLKRWEESIRIPLENVETATAAAIAEARAQTAQLVDLPAGEAVDLEIVHDEPWMAFCEYQGGLRSEISVNVDLPMPAIGLLVLAMHETYPGHHTEACCKEQLLVRGRGLLEETIVLVPTPQSLVSEGIAKVAPTMPLKGAGGPALAALVGLDLDLALEIVDAREPLEWADVNAALMLYEEGASEDETRAYLERWGLRTPQMAAHLIRFLNEPASRSYVLTYSAGRDLCSAFVAGDPARFRHLLTQQLRVRDLLDPAS
jgi:hypothetical protein